jgi:ubiquitin-protein ligase
MPDFSKKVIKWLNDNKDIEMIIKDHENNLSIEYCGHVLNIKISDDYPEKYEYIITSDSKLIELHVIINDLNEFIHDKKPNLPTLLNKIKKLFERNKEALIKKELDVDDIKHETALFDVKEYKIAKIHTDLSKNKLKHYAESNISVTKDIIKLYSKEKIADIIIDRYIDVCKKHIDNRLISVLIDDYNIYTWKLRFNNFSNTKLISQLNNLNDKFKYSYIEIELNFHHDYYPLYPISVKVVRPRLSNLLMHKISNLKMVQLDYWKSNRTPLFIIDKLYDIIDKHANIEVDNELNSLDNADGAYYFLEDSLIQLSSLSNNLSNNSIDDIDDTPSISSSSKKIETSSLTHVRAWAKGVGYGYDGIDSGWNIDEYNKMLEEKDKKIENVLITIISKIEKLDIEHDFENLNLVNKVIKDSYLIDFFNNYIKGTTFLEINNHKKVYIYIFKIILLLMNKSSFLLFTNHISIIEEIIELHEQVLEINELKANVDDIKLKKLIIEINVKMKPYYDEYLKTISKEEVIKDDIDEIEKINGIDINKKDKLKYIDEIKPEIYGLDDILNVSGKWKFHYKDSYLNQKKKGDSLKSKDVMRISHELNALKKSCPIYYESSIAVRRDEDNPSLIRGCISGPDGTPYDSGLFFFDGFMHNEYPRHPPHFNFINHGKHRHNPNLYDSGKVCLSLLGTWGTSNKGESWNQETSTISQIFISIQSLILVKDPFFNEPGYERHMHEKEYITENLLYNFNRRIYTIQDCMNQIIEHPIPSFENFIRKHFLCKRNYILKLVEGWIDEIKQYEEKHKSRPSKFDSEHNFHDRITKQYEILVKNLSDDVLNKIVQSE